MNSDPPFLEQDAAELERFLVQQARRDRAPRAAHERALVTLSSLSLGAGLTASAKLAWGASAASQVTPWLVTKWIAVGMTASLATFAAAEGLHHAFTARETTVDERKQTPPGAAPRLPGAERAKQSPAAAGLSAAVPAASSHAAPGSASAPSGPAPTVEPAATSTHLPSSTAFGAASSEASAQLTREVARLQRARSSLVAGSPSAALEALNGYAREFPSGALRAEAAALRVEAVAALGNRALAQSLASEFLTRFPSSPLSARVRAVSGLAHEKNKP